MARARPYATAVACPTGRDRYGRTAYTHLSFAALDRESDVLARGLAAVGVCRGARAALLVKPGLEFFALTFALFKAGAVPVLIDPGIGVRNLGRCLAEAAPQAFIGIPRAELARRLLGWAKETVRVSVTVAPATARWGIVDGPPPGPVVRGPLRLGLDDVRMAGWSDEPFPIVVAPPGETAAILFTSGSTGPPKGAVYTHAIFAAQVAILHELYGIEPGEIDLCTFPLFALFAPALGMTSIVPEMDATRPGRVDGAKIIEAIETFGATNLFGSPALIRRVGDFGVERAVKLPSLRRVISAGAPVPARVLERFATMLAPGVQIFTPYGATEALPVSSMGSDAILNETRNATDRGAGICLGLPVPGIRVELIRICDESIAEWSDDLAVPGGTIGEIVVQGTVVTREYFRRPDATRLAKIATTGDPGGPVMHRMGDLGYRDNQGRLWFCGRKAHRVVTTAGTLFTIPCEAVFNTHPDVSRTALVGIGEPGAARPVLCVEPVRWPLSKAQRERLVADLEAIGQRYEHTRAIEIFLFHRSFPVDVRHNAKIVRERLAAWSARRVR
jgi:acyl-CoA synthetase (AMP-forming)/AMP-acid ligase II